MGLMQRAAAWLADALDQAAGVPVTYSRGSSPGTLVEAPLTAVPAASAPGVVQPGQPAVRTPTTDRDYLIRLDALTAAGLYPPRPGDRVREAISGFDTTFVVTKRQDGPAYEWGEPDRVTVRIRTVPKT